MNKRYERPIMLADTDIAEGIFMASGTTVTEESFSVNCYQAKFTPMNDENFLKDCGNSFVTVYGVTSNSPLSQVREALCNHYRENPRFTLLHMVSDEMQSAWLDDTVTLGDYGYVPGSVLWYYKKG